MATRTVTFTPYSRDSGTGGKLRWGTSDYYSDYSSFPQAPYQIDVSITYVYGNYSQSVSGSGMSFDVYLETSNGGEIKLGSSNLPTGSSSNKRTVNLTYTGSASLLTSYSMSEVKLEPTGSRNDIRATSSSSTATLTFYYNDTWINAPTNLSVTQTDYNAFKVTFNPATGSGTITHDLAMWSTSEHADNHYEGITNGATIYFNDLVFGAPSYGYQQEIYISASNGYDSASSNTVYITFTDRTSCGPPSGLTLAKAILNAGKTCNLTWTAGTAGTWNAISKYEVQYAESSDNSTWGSWTAVSTPTSTSATATASSTRGNYRKYRVRTIGRWADSYTSAWVETSGRLRCRPKATIPTWTDSTLTAGTTPIKAIHMTQLQTGANNLRATWGLNNGSYSTITAGSTSLKDWKTHVQQIRTAIDETGDTHTDWTALPTENKPSAAIIQQIRDVLVAMA